MLVPFMTKAEVIKHNEYAIKGKFNRTLDPSKLEQLDSETLLPVVFSVPVDDAQMIRAQVCFDSKGSTGWLDMLPKYFDSLRRIEA